MCRSTRLEPFPAEQARQWLEWMPESTADESAALMLDDQGRLLGIVGADAPLAEHRLGNRDVLA
jgi:hypothetical protein